MFIYCICTQYLVGASFALITASIRRGMEVISLWHCWGGMKPRFLLDNTSYILYVQVWWVCWSVKHTNTWSFNQLLVLLAVWAGAKSCWKMKSASLKSWSAEGSMKCSKTPRHVCVWCSWCLDPSLSPFLVKFTQILELILLDNPHKAAGLSVGCASFSSTLFLPLNFLLTCLDTALCEQLLW